MPLPVPFSPVTRTLASDGPTREISSSTGRIDTASAMSIGRTSGLSDRFSASSRCCRRSARASSTWVRTMRQQPRVLPRLLHEVAGAAAHRFDRHFDAAPGGHDDDRQRRIVRAQLRQQVEPFLARGRVARVVEVHQHRVELVAVDRLENRRRRSGRLDPVALALEEQPQRLEDIRLIVRDQDARRSTVSDRIGVWSSTGHRCASATGVSMCRRQSAVSGPAASRQQAAV